jgi:hypothetical protein
MISHLNGGLRYRSAVAFDEEFPLRTEEAVQETPQEAGTPPIPQPPGPEQAEGSLDGSTAGQEPKGVVDTGFTTVTACVQQEELDLSELFRINKW